MKIEESCKAWTAVFEIPGFPEVTEEELKAIKMIIHASGDVMAILASLPEELTSEMRETIIGTIGFIMAEAKNSAIMSVDNILGNVAMKTPLENEFSSANIFGLDLKETLTNALTDKELAIAMEHFPELDPKQESDDDPEPDETDE